MRLSACIVVKNEALTLGATLDSLRGHVDDVVVVDGGSSDSSVAIATAAGAKVFVDEGSVSAARNRAFEHARGDYCVMIDGDEVARPASWNALSEFVRDRAHPRGRILQVSETSNGTASLWVTRVCVRDPAYRYEGRVHEQLVGPGSIGNTGLVVDHSGYSPATLARKKTGARNTKLLETELADQPRSAYLHYQLGKTLFVDKEFERAVPYFREALRLAPPDAAYLSALACDLGYALKDSGRPRDALDLLAPYQLQFPDYTDLHFLEALCHLQVGDVGCMLAAFRHCLVLGEAPLYPTVLGVGSYRAHYNLGLYAELSGDRNSARLHYEQALEASDSFVLARERLDRLAKT